jgi:hypothetical protein
MFLIDIPFKGCQGRSNRSSIEHAVSAMVCKKNLKMHAVSMTPHAFFKIRISSQIRIYMLKGFSPLIRSPGRMF